MYEQWNSKAKEMNSVLNYTAKRMNSEKWLKFYSKGYTYKQILKFYSKIYEECLNSTAKDMRGVP